MAINIHNAEFIISAVKSSQFPDDDLPEVVFVGRSNVGKSSILNALLNRKNLAYVGNTPGKTREINFFKLWMHFITTKALTYSGFDLS